MDPAELHLAMDRSRLETFLTGLRALRVDLEVQEAAILAGLEALQALESSIKTSLEATQSLQQHNASNLEVVRNAVMQLGIALPGCLVCFRFPNWLVGQNSGSLAG